MRFCECRLKRRVVRQCVEHVGIDVPARVVGEVLFEVVGDFRVVLHAHVRFGPARVTTEMLFFRTLEVDDFEARFQRGDRGREARDTASDDQQVGFDL
ncbi:hypothetical protein D3C87_1094590 [compost metagenome]